MQHVRQQSSPILASPVLGWMPLIALAGVLGCLVPLIGYLLFPEAGIEAFANLFTPKKAAALVIALFGLSAYLIYWRWIMQKPHWLLYLTILAWPLIEFGNQVLLDDLGINIHLRPLLLIAFAFPAGWLMWRHAPTLWQQLPYARYYLIFFMWVTLYFIFYNANATDPRWGMEGIWSEGSVGIVQITAYFYCLLGIGIAAVSFLRHPKPRQLFDQFNIALIAISSILSLITLICYPLEELTLYVDGFLRAAGFFTHPNPFAHHMGILLVYLLGMILYYQSQAQKSIPLWLLWSGFLVNIAAFLLGLSKTAFAVFSLCAGLLIILNLGSRQVRATVFKAGILFLVIFPMVLMVFQMITGQSFAELLTARLDENTSLKWREEIWTILAANMSGVELFFGHGFTAANAKVFQMTFNDFNNAKPLMMIHNGYLALLYDHGVLGWSLFVSVLALLGNTIKAWFSSITPQLPLYTTILALSVYFLIVCGFDEMTYMFDAPRLYWSFSTILFVLILQERRRVP